MALDNNIGNSWASEVEEEHEATGWKGLPLDTASQSSLPAYEGGNNTLGSSLPAYEGGNKPKRGKKKKKRNKGAVAATTDFGNCLSNNFDDGRDGQVESSGSFGHTYNGKANVGISQTSRNPSTERARSFGVPRGGFQNLNDWETANKRKANGPSQPQGVRKVETQAYKNEVWGNRPSDACDSWTSACQANLSSASSNQKGRPSQLDSASTGNKDARNGELNPHLLLKLLPSEKGPEIEYTESAGTATSGTRKATTAFFPPAEFLDNLPDPVDSDDACSDADLDNDSDWIGSDILDSDASDESLDTKKCNKWFRSFFETLDDLTNEQIAEHDRQWHCPACKGGVGAIDWYRGLQPLIAHTKTWRTKRVKLHRDFANILEEDLTRRQAAAGNFGATKFGKWKGLREDDESTNPLIIWPPMVIIQNTQLELDEQDKWIGMGNKELLEMFKEYNAKKARHAYGPQGHRGMSIVIFSDSPTGYIDAQRLAKHFRDSRRGKEHWHHPGKVIFHPGGDRILYGYMATDEDMVIFNRHSAGKAKLKWEQKRYQEAVGQPMRRMDEENQQLNLLKQKVIIQKEHSKTLEKTISLVARKLELREKEISVIRHRATEQHEEYQKEMDDLERSYKDTIMQLSKDISRREEEIHKRQEQFKQEQVQRCEQLEKTYAEIPEDNKLGEEQQQQQQAKMEEAIARQTEVVESSLQDYEDYEVRKRELLKKHHLKKLDFMRKQYDAQIKFEKQLDNERGELLEKYRRQREEACSNLEK